MNMISEEERVKSENIIREVEEIFKREKVTFGMALTVSTVLTARTISGQHSSGQMDTKKAIKCSMDTAGWMVTIANDLIMTDLHDKVLREESRGKEH